MKKRQIKKPAVKKPKKAESSRLPVPVSAPVEKEPVSTSGKTFHIVAMGASAGGLEAFEQFFTKMPADSGMAIVLIPHLDPRHKSILGDLLKRYTQMKVFEAEDAMPVKPNFIYTIPPNKDMAIMNGRLHLLEPMISHGIRHPIDFFFRSLAEDFKDKSICIVLSGTGSEGALGLRSVKGEGGLVMAQENPVYDGMPQSAIATGLVDYILPAAKMPEQLMAYVRRAYVKPVKIPAKPEKTMDSLHKILVLVRAQTGHDFSQYKENTITRRVERRMAVHQIDNITQYVYFLRTNPGEIDILFRELLIRVTNFFRDADAFKALKKNAFPLILQGKPAGYTARIWVPGCSTGEEAYSLAILAQEYMEKTKKKFRVQIFATDVDSAAIDIARNGIYPESITVDVSPRRLDRFFTKEDGAFRVKTEIREQIVFAVHNLIKDPPFSKVDLISCRNLLIYVGTELQEKVIPLFNYALNPGGILFLGTSETIGGFADMFRVMDKKWKVFQSRRAEPAALHIPTEAPRPFHARGFLEPGRKITRSSEQSIREMIEPMLLDQYTPAAAVVNESGDILYIHGRTGKFLEPASGKASFNILEMARDGLKLDLASALRKAVKNKNDVTVEGLEVRSNGGYIRMKLEVKPASGPEKPEGLFTVIFHEVLPVRELKPAPAGEAGKKMRERCADLQTELKATKERLQASIEELETSNEELKSANEELQSSTEELQSTNEELETSREELQSTNEELLTVNAELQNKVEELANSNSDMSNMLSSTRIPTIFLDRNLRIRRFTPAVTDVMNLIEGDIGRPLTDIVSKLDYPELAHDCAAVLKTLAPKEKVVSQREGKWFFLAKLAPYRTIENVIDGVVLTFTDISELKGLEEALSYAEDIIDTAQQGIVLFNDRFRVVKANKEFYRLFKLSAPEVEGGHLFKLAKGKWDIPVLKRKLDDLLSSGKPFEELRIEYALPGSRSLRKLPAAYRSLLKRRTCSLRSFTTGPRTT